MSVLDGLSVREALHLPLLLATGVKRARVTQDESTSCAREQSGTQRE
jgi:hypothetical protein